MATVFIGITEVEVVEKGDDLWKIEVQCRFCRNIHIIEVNNHQMKALLAHERFIQQILPDHTVEERELLISGTCSACWQEIINELDG